MKLFYYSWSINLLIYNKNYYQNWHIKGIRDIFFFIKFSFILYVIKQTTCYFLPLIKIQSNFWGISNLLEAQNKRAKIDDLTTSLFPLSVLFLLLKAFFVTKECSKNNALLWSVIPHARSLTKFVFYLKSQKRIKYL